MTTPLLPDASPEHVAFDFAALTERERYKLMIGSIVPRPIALVTTVDPEGRVNAAPFSFFNCLSADPPILALGVENHDDMSFKDTARNVRLTEVFTVNIVSRAIAEAMHVCAVPFPPGVDELAAAGLTALPGVKVASPFIAQAPAAFECRRHITLELGRSRQIILGEILYAHYRSEVADPARLRIDPATLDAIARLGGSTCCTIRDRFEMPTPSLAEWDARQAGE
ncbi:flavin reductase family protein [Ancylobacter sp. 6x-1]|uniref:Flavin reductase family protein n=1 Tax=Ancylobacter crimeensis TaxID=2579147 RepID=A0ABT0DCL8_9HYPH|nr:flavin reductase family protein [Ancylobacter crimeensis]MCK0197708.1 flavin reductase family protein [Ancylobacter crimeensis]